MKRGPAKGSMRRGSLVALLSQLGDGKSLILDTEEASEGTPTRLERNVQTVMHRSPALTGARFKTERLRYIDGNQLKPALRITRID